MTILFLIVIIIASLILSLIVLVQNPKGGGLAGTFAGFSTQFMGVKQTTDVLEKGTWLFAGIIAVLSLVSTIFISGGKSADDSSLEKLSNRPVNTAPANQNTQPAQTPPAQIPAQ